MWPYYLLAVVGALLVLFIIVVSLQPSQFRIARSKLISAEPARIFSEVNELRRWEAWSPWAKMDPQMKQEYTGPASGVGAVHAWNGNKQVGSGRITITDSQPDQQVDLRLEMFTPFPCDNQVRFTFEPQGGGTLVTWAMTGTNNFMGKAMGLFMNFDKMVGADFENGLSAIKAIVE